MTDLLLQAEPRTLNVNQAELYSFYTNDTNAFNNIIAIGGQLVALTVVLGGASVAYTAIRGDQISSDLELGSVVNDLTRDQTAATNIVSTLGYSTIIAATYYFLSQLGEPASKRRKVEDDPDLLFQTNFIDRQGFNPLDAVTGFLDGILSYAVVFRTIIFFGIGASGIIIFWAFMSILPNGRRKRSLRHDLFRQSQKSGLIEEYLEIFSKINANAIDFT